MISLLLACSQPADTGSATAAPDTVPELPEIERASSTATWGPADIEDAFAAALVDGFPDTQYIHDVYLDVLTHGDTECPGHETYIDDTWLYGCTAESGYWYSGVSEYFNEDNSSFAVEGVSGDFRFEDPEGRDFSAGGHVAAAIGYKAPKKGRVFDFAGSWIWRGEEEKSWLKNGISGYQTTLVNSSSDSDFINMQGAVTFNGLSLSFSEFNLLSVCNWQATGQVAVRDPGGTWHHLDFGPKCSPCARVTWEGEDLGEACPDFSPIADTFQPYLKEQ